MKIREKLTYANVMATIAVFLALGGGAAIAAGSLSGKEKKQVGKIAAKVFEARIGGATVKHALSADTATNAASAARAVDATRAADAERLGGRLAGQYQRPQDGGCATPLAINSIDGEGKVTCVSPVTAIDVTAAAGEFVPLDLGNGLRIVTACHSGGVTKVTFQNVGGSQTGLLGYVGGITKAGSGFVELPAGTGEKTFDVENIRLEGQFVYSIGAAVMTIGINIIDNTKFCPINGTVLEAYG